MHELANEIVLNVFFSFLIAIPATIVIRVLYSVLLIFRKKKIVSEARKGGRVVCANLIDVKHTLQQDMGAYENKVESIYEYYYKGRRYTHKEWFVYSPPETLELFIEGNPSKACTEGKFGLLKGKKLVFAYLIAVIISSIVLTVIK